MPRKSHLAGRDFWDFVDKSDEGCWLWTGRQNNMGYGHDYFPDYKKTLLAHRLAYELSVGPIPEGLHLDHLCRTPLCVNPDHLEPVTHRENLLRGNTFAARNAAKTHCVHGHELTPENVYLRKDRIGRLCMECRRAVDRKRRPSKRRLEHERA